MFALSLLCDGHRSAIGLPEDYHGIRIGITIGLPSDCHGFVMSLPCYGLRIAIGNRRGTLREFIRYIYICIYIYTHMYKCV